MMKKLLTVLCLSLMVIAVLGCASQPTEAPAEGAAPAGEVALKLTGKVNSEMGWTEADVRAMETMEAQRENKSGEMETYTGVSLNALLDKAGVGDDATAVVFVADDGYEAEAALADIRACQDCIVAFNEDGGFSMILPGLPNNMQVKGVVEIRVQ